ncbi:MAG: ABC transporter ATP-binding protein [Ignavibacteriaceae bacterium]
MYLAIENIIFSYTKERKILNDVSFNLGKGETISIVGTSGCGKSTLLRVISGILISDHKYQFSGEVLIDNLTPDEFRKTGKLSFMFQEPTLMPNLTVKENIELPLSIKKIKNNTKVDELLNTVGLFEYADYLPKQLSGGMKTRVALARSFITKPELLLLDEPFSDLDIAWKTELYKELNSLKEKYGTTVLLVTHDIEEAITLSNNNILILGQNGTIIFNANLNGKADLKEEIKFKILEDRNIDLAVGYETK